MWKEYSTQPLAVQQYNLGVCSVELIAGGGGVTLFCQDQFKLGTALLPSKYTLIRY